MCLYDALTISLYSVTFSFLCYKNKEKGSFGEGRQKLKKLMQLGKLIKKKGFITYLPRMILRRNNVISTVLGNQYLPRFFQPFRNKMD